MGNHTNGSIPIAPAAPPGPKPVESFWDTIVDFASAGGNFLRFLAIVVAAYIASRGIRWLYVRMHRGRPTSAQLLAGKGIMLAVVFVGIWVGIQYVYQVDPVGMFATLGIVSLALGFGLQNTVANLAAGVSLSIDKPFDVGDRIRVGDTWGDVINVGFRSTSIRTTAGEHVVVPNAILDTQEVWNYTSQRHTELRVEIPLQISYASSFPLAEEVALRIVRDTPHVLAYPEPRLLMRGLGSDGLDMEIRFWLADPLEKAKVVDYILRRVKLRFDEAGVHFPFPQRSVSYLKDEVTPAPTPEHLIGEHASKPLAIALIRSPLSSANVPNFVASFAKAADARLVLVHVRPPVSTMHPEEGQTALNKCVAAARRAGVSVQVRMEIGSVPAVVAQVAKQEGAKVLLLVRAGRHGKGRGWMRADQVAIQKATQVPVQLLEPDTPLAEKTLTFWHDRLHPPVVEAKPEQE